MRDLTKWIDIWDHPALHAGIPGKGAQDAWYHTALTNELNLISRRDIGGGSIDIYKCFDQINRILLKKIAEIAGMPRRVVEPYFRWLDNMQSAFQFGKKIGLPHHDRASIPQGCPFSMMMVALLMMPWVKLAERNNIIPRVLADDLLFTAEGEKHVELIIKGVELSCSALIILRI